MQSSKIWANFIKVKKCEIMMVICINKRVSNFKQIEKSIYADGRTNGRKKIRAATLSQIQLCSRDMTADVITVDIAPRNLARRRNCCAEFSRKTHGSQLRWIESTDSRLIFILFRGESNFVEPVCSLNIRKRLLEKKSIGRLSAVVSDW